MTENRRQHDCPPTTDNPADQPKAPDAECKKFEDPEPPDFKDPTPCPPSDCKCPAGPTSTSSCLEDLITEKAGALAAAEKAKALKADLEALLGKAKTASAEYTRDKHDKLVKQWLEQDEAIAELIRKLACAVPCWRCVIECYICPLLNQMQYAEARLHSPTALAGEVRNLHDMQFWRTRDRDAKERRFTRIKAVLAVWEKPAQAIEKALSDNGKLIADIGKSLGTDASKLVYDVFLKLVPMHLAIAPVTSDTTTTRIDKKYTVFCPCETYEPDDCCGVDVGAGSLRQRLVGVQPHLLDPDDYFELLCCLVKNRYLPAQQTLGDAEAELAKIDELIKRDKAVIENGLKTFEKDAKGRIPAVVDCCDFEENGEEPQPTPRSR